jgi:hypothetical protein
MVDGRLVVGTSARSKIAAVERIVKHVVSA